MYKLLIVEDEPEIRNGLLNMVDWPSLNIAIAGTAGDGAEAWRLIEAERPDIVLSDIEMPRMSGLELLRKIQEAGLPIVTVILSGHGKFTYTKQALQDGAYEYLLKPCNSQEIKAVMENATSEWERRMAQERNLIQQSTKWSRSLSLAKQQVFQHWLHYPKNPVEDRRSLLEQMDMTIPFEGLTVFLFRIDADSLAKKEWKTEEAELLRYAVINILQESVPPNLFGSLELIRSREDILLIGSVDPELPRNELRSALEKMQAILGTYLKVSVSIGVCGDRHDVNTLHVAYQETLRALGRMFFQGGGGIYFADEPESEHSQAGSVRSGPSAIQLEKAIVELIRAGKFEAAVDRSEEWLESVKQFNDRANVQLQAVSFIAGLAGLANEFSDKDGSWKMQFPALTDQLQRMETFDELTAWISRIMSQIAESMNIDKPIHKTVLYAKEIIEKQYRENITMESIAKEVFVSANYLSTLFKQELGIRFLDYLHQHRIQQAKHLLKKSDLKMYAVAREVGYTDERYFAKIFKKWTGMTPSEFMHS